MTKYIILEDCPLGAKGEEVSDKDIDPKTIDESEQIHLMFRFLLLKLNVIAVKDEKFVCPKKGIIGHELGCDECEKYETPKRWRPEINQTYYYFDGAGMKLHTHWANDFADVARLAFGNVFRTEEEATAKALEVKKVLLAPVINEKK